MDYVSLQEAARLTGKSEMTIRRLTKKPGGKPNTRLDDGKILVNKEWLYKHYPPIQAEPLSEQKESPPIQEPIQPIQEPIQPIQNAYTELIQELKADKEYLQKQLETERAQYHERQRESNIIIQTMQKQLPEHTQQYDQQPTQQKKLPYALIAIVVALILAVSWIVYSESTRVEKVPETANTTENGRGEPISNFMLNREVQEIDSTRTSVVPMDSTIQN
jgi:hypothetical protein